MRLVPIRILLILLTGVVNASHAQTLYKEPHRPQFHFSPKAHWMNDPNGMVYNEGVYHLFFQYYPGATVWGPMHWGHATSNDLMHWKEQTIALYPDSLGYIFSGSAVVDKKNTSGFGKAGKPPLVAIFTYHDPVGEKEGRNNYQSEGLAYSIDNGKTWMKYSGNPVLNNPGITDFRDPKVMWFEKEKKWIMTLAIKDHIGFYSSPDLKNWKEESQFGKSSGAHGGVWECPDLFSMDDNGKTRWILIVNINPGGPNGGSATQYFIGEFDGKSFTADHTDTRWIDYGPDEYAGVLWNNVGNRKIFLGWMSNWLYATVVPTEKWRSAMTIPRELSLKHVGKEIYIASTPSPEIKKIQSTKVLLHDIKFENPAMLLADHHAIPCRLDISLDKTVSFSMKFSNDAGEELVIGFDKNTNEYFIDRTKSGQVNFHKEFAARHVAPRISNSEKMNLILIVDVSSLELFADDGLTTMTSIFFPTMPYSKFDLYPNKTVMNYKVAYSKLSGTWEVKKRK